MYNVINKFNNEIQQQNYILINIINNRLFTSTKEYPESLGNKFFSDKLISQQIQPSFNYFYSKVINPYFLFISGSSSELLEKLLTTRYVAFSNNRYDEFYIFNEADLTYVSMNDTNKVLTNGSTYTIYQLLTNKPINLPEKSKAYYVFRLIQNKNYSKEYCTQIMEEWLMELFNQNPEPYLNKLKDTIYRDKLIELLMKPAVPLYKGSLTIAIDKRNPNCTLISRSFINKVSFFKDVPIKPANLISLVLNASVATKAIVVEDTLIESYLTEFENIKVIGNEQALVDLIIGENLFNELIHVDSEYILYLLEPEQLSILNDFITISGSFFDRLASISTEEHERLSMRLYEQAEDIINQFLSIKPGAKYLSGELLNQDNSIELMLYTIPRMFIPDEVYKEALEKKEKLAQKKIENRELKIEGIELIAISDIISFFNNSIFADDEFYNPQFTSNQTVALNDERIFYKSVSLEELKNRMGYLTDRQREEAIAFYTELEPSSIVFKEKLGKVQLVTDYEVNLMPQRKCLCESGKNYKECCFLKDELHYMIFNACKKKLNKEIKSIDLFLYAKKTIFATLEQAKRKFLSENSLHRDIEELEDEWHSDYFEKYRHPNAIQEEVLHFEFDDVELGDTFINYHMKTEESLTRYTSGSEEPSNFLKDSQEYTEKTTRNVTFGKAEIKLSLYDIKDSKPTKQSKLDICAPIMAKSARLRKQGEVYKAIEMLMEAIKYAPHLSLPYYNLGRALYAKDLNLQSAKAFKIAYDLGYYEGEILEHLGNSLLEDEYKSTVFKDAIIYRQMRAVPDIVDSLGRDIEGIFEITMLLNYYNQLCRYAALVFIEQGGVWNEEYAKIFNDSKTSTSELSKETNKLYEENYFAQAVETFEMAGDTKLSEKSKELNERIISFNQLTDYKSFMKLSTDRLTKDELLVILQTLERQYQIKLLGFVDVLFNIPNSFINGNGRRRRVFIRSCETLEVIAKKIFELVDESVVERSQVYIWSAWAINNTVVKLSTVIEEGYEDLDVNISESVLTIRNANFNITTETKNSYMQFTYTGWNRINYNYLLPIEKSSKNQLEIYDQTADELLDYILGKERKLTNHLEDLFYNIFKQNNNLID